MGVCVFVRLRDQEEGSMTAENVVRWLEKKFKKNSRVINKIVMLNNNISVIYVCIWVRGVCVLKQSKTKNKTK